ncbi:MAG TPA: hypothetical protein VMD74_05520 [Candidatus Methylomirabilis sp.]|nr:hypothetical protein [Candidatus Methylomirabilis sp.]
MAEFEAAIEAGDPKSLEEAWLFYDRVEEKFRTEIAKKRVIILEAALEICPLGITIPFFGSRRKIQEKIDHCQKDLPSRQESGEGARNEQ